MLKAALPGFVVIRILSVTILSATLCCGFAGQAMAQQAKPRDVVRFATITGLGTPGVSTAIERGYFAEEGIDVTIQPLGGGPAVVSAVIGGSADIGYGDVLALSAGIANGQKLKILTPANGGADLDVKLPGHVYSILVAEDSNISKASDLVGKRIGIGPTLVNRVAIKRWLERNGVATDAVSVVVLGSIPAVNLGLKSGNVDAVLTTDPFVQLAQSDFGAVPIASPLSDLPREASIAVTYSTDAFLERNPDLARRFARAYRKGAKDFLAASNPERVRIVDKYSQLGLAKIAKIVPNIEKSLNFYKTQDSAFDVKATQDWVDTAVRFKELPARIELRDHLFETALNP